MLYLKHKPLPQLRAQASVQVEPFSPNRRRGEAPITAEEAVLVGMALVAPVVRVVQEEVGTGDTSMCLIKEIHRITGE